MTQRKGEWGPPKFPAPPTRAETGTDFTQDMPIAWTPGVQLRSGRVTLGGSPWQVIPLPTAVLPFARKLFAAGRAGLRAKTQSEQNAAVYLLDCGLADPLPIADQSRTIDDVEIVIPVFRHADSLERTLASLQPEGLPMTVVDDASPSADAARIKQAAEAHGAKLIVLPENRGPGDARAAGFAASTAPFVAFIDADAQAAPNWVARLRPLFDDPLLGALGPRVRPDVQGISPIEMYEDTRSELDMGPEPSRIVYGAAVGWLPSASVIVRRSAVTDPIFEPGLRVGEDVDLFWRMDEAGWTVRYVPDVVNYHEVRTSLKDFMGRRAMYGGSAADLELRHPRRLIPAQPSLSGLAVLAAVALRKPWLAAGVVGYEFLRQRRILTSAVPPLVAAEVTARSLWSDGFWLGHLLRRDWWPIGWLIVLATPRSRLARGVAAAMLWEPVRDHLLRPTRLDPIRSLVLRAIDDASYGTGVIRNAIRKRVLNVVMPRVRTPTWPKRPGD